VQAVFQDSEASLDPRMRIGATVREGLDIHGIRDRAGRADRVLELLDQVGLDAGYAARFPHTLSGGQRQRVNIARALALDPAILVADEPVSALDVAIQAQILDLFADLRARLGLTLIFISHDLSIVEALCDRIAILRGGILVEEGPVAEVMARPRHAYTRQLLEAVPRLPDPKKASQPHTPPPATTRKPSLEPLDG
jgi:peptide/nickel transport system ATP-binding protein